MNNCEKFRDLIITLYIDHEADLPLRSEIDTHLQVCPACREFAHDVGKNLVVPFQNVRQAAVPGHVWSSIKERLEQEGYSGNPIKNSWQQWSEILSFPRLATVMAGFAVLVLIATSVFHDQQIKQAKDTETGKYLVYLLGTTDFLSDKEDRDLETPIEKYFL